MNLTNIILNVAKPLSIVALLTIPTFAMAQSNISYADFESDEIAIIANGNKSEHIIKEESAAIHDKLIETGGVIADVSTKLSHDEALGKVDIDQVKDSRIHSFAGLIFFFVISMAILAILKLFDFSGRLAVADKYINNLIKNLWEKTDFYTRIIVTGWFLIAIPLLVIILLETLFAMYYLSFHYLFTPIFSGQWYVTVINEYMVPSLQYLIEGFRKFLESIKYILAIICVIFLMLFILASLANEKQQRDEWKRKMIKEELEKTLCNEERILQAYRKSLKKYELKD
ncbi:hypothetical protein E6W26_28965 [Pseudomonas aeruginosa]|uniref:hypothetical protein n=1 Tax=Pseudomonas aeruginosa TaxID=287 RepID=UPI00109DE560|nr:hypothetical protein [Pseudomonas aeruginosa]EKV1241295.1 hypothetical protein [Pseudomonas aeruginosa]EKV8586204.1 hypothetical protein [Pseudomonas aeruginosa]ELN5407422.1 hypothetical protein [Pseudomonas aeruginosa]ELP1438613.1 hypothetical protein [Pseudomonas aeruginosa]THB16430.1 hypothetical protein E6W26_28965 [Pseudomonas aeruginosa]